jgi:hypothetical protein
MLRNGDDELETLAVGFADLLRQGMGDHSLHALTAALDAARRDGVSGVLSLKIPGRPKDRPDAIFFLGGGVDLVHRWGS